MRVSPLLLCLLFGAAGCTTPANDSEHRSHDAYRGMDPDGRIPKVEFPEDIPNPDRWRYLPEGRIMEGDIFERFLVSTFFVPLFFFEGDVGAGAGVAFTDIDFRNQRRQEFATSRITYTTEGQAEASFLWRRWLDQRDAEGGGVFQEERSFVQLFAGYSNTLTRRFYGIGPETEATDETSFADKSFAVEASIQRSVPEPGDEWVVNAGLHLEARRLSDGFVEEVPSTPDVYPALFARDDELDSVWVQAALRYDTRDSQRNPYRGWSLGVWGNGTPWMTGGRSGVVYGSVGTGIVPLPPLLHDGADGEEENPPTDVLAFTAQVEDSAGELPFWALPTLGGTHRLRGFVPGRFRDAAAWFAAAEYRFVVVPRGTPVTRKVRIERLGLALFYELGAVGSGLGNALDQRGEYSYGISGRVNLERAAIFRVDLGFSDEGSNLTIQYGLSF